MIKNSNVPCYRKHRQIGQAVVTLPDGLGTRRDILLGKFEPNGVRAGYHGMGSVGPTFASAGSLE